MHEDWVIRDSLFHMCISQVQIQMLVGCLAGWPFKLHGVAVCRVPAPVAQRAIARGFVYRYSHVAMFRSDARMLGGKPT